MNTADTTNLDDQHIMQTRRKWRGHQPPPPQDVWSTRFPDLPAEIRNTIYDMVLDGKSRMHIKQHPHTRGELVFEEAAFDVPDEIHAEYYSLMEAHAWEKDTTIVCTVPNFYLDQAIPIYNRIFGSKKNPSPVPKGGHGWRPKLMIRCDFDMNMHDYRVKKGVVRSMKTWFNRVQSDGDTDEIDYEIGQFSKGWTIQNPIMVLRQKERTLKCAEFYKLGGHFQQQMIARQKVTDGRSRLFRLLQVDDTDDEMEDDDDEYLEDDEMPDHVEHTNEGHKKPADQKGTKGEMHADTIDNNGREQSPVQGQADDARSLNEDDCLDDFDNTQHDLSDLQDDVPDDRHEDESVARVYTTEDDMNVYSDSGDEEDSDEEPLPENELEGDEDDWMPDVGYYNERRYGHLQGGDPPSWLDVALFRAGQA